MTGRQASKDRSEGCILCNPNTPITSEVPTISIPGQNFPLHLSSLWPLLCPMGVHKDSEASLGCIMPNGVRMIVYIDDILLIAESKEQVLD